MLHCDGNLPTQM